jgi:hypothetical protein
VDPLALPSGVDDARLPQISQVPRNLGLVRLQDFDEVTHAYLILPYQVQKSQAGAIREGTKEQLHIEAFSGPGHRAKFNRKYSP